MKKAVLSFLLIGLPLHAIGLRHDVSEEASLAAARRFAPVVVDINVPYRTDPKRRGGNGNGTLIAPRWVLTAAHIASRVMAGHERSRVSGEHSVTINGRDYVVQRIVLHPDWRTPEDIPTDIALIQLAQPVSGVEPVPLYASKDEQGKMVTLVGTGTFGRGDKGPIADAPTRMRAVTNMVDEVVEESISFDYDAPSAKDATPLEGVSGTGDSGGPAFIETNGRVYLAGVSSLQNDLGFGEGRYGAREFYVRVSHYKPWIDSVIGGGETEKILAAAIDYGEGWYSGDAARMERALHPDLAKRIAARDKVEHMTAAELIAGTRSGGGSRTPKAKQIVNARLLDHFGNAASVRLEMGGWIDYMHLAKFNGEWKIVNVLWEMKPR